MKKTVWIPMIVAAACILAGLACISVGHVLGGHKNMTSADNRPMTTATHDVAEDFDRISVHVGAADVKLLPSETQECRVVTTDIEQIFYTVEVTDSSLTVRAEDTRKWYDHLFVFSGNNSTVTVYLPADTYKSLYARTVSGKIEVDSAFAFTEDVTLTVTSGSVTMAASVEGHTDVKTTSGSIRLSGKAGALTAHSTSGSVCVDHLTVAGEAKLSSTSGRIEVKNTQAGALTADVGSGRVILEDVTVTNAITAETTSGGITLTRVSGGSMALDTGSGAVELTDTTATGHLQAETTSGSIRLTRADAATLNLKAGSGSVKGSLRTPKIFYTDTGSGSVDVPKSTEGGLCEIKTTSGSIHITLEE